MELAEKVDELQLNKFYSVACAEMKSDDGKICYVPVIPILHKDPQFGSLGRMKHYHVDGRFISKSYIGGVHITHGKTNQVIAINDPKPYFQFQRIVRKKRKCIRMDTGLEIPGGIYGNQIPTSWSSWYKSMLGKSCEGKKCPHFGTNMVEINGRWKCPVHNLEGCPKTKKIIEPRDLKLL